MSKMCSEFLCPGRFQWPEQMGGIQVCIRPGDETQHSPIVLLFNITQIMIYLVLPHLTHHYPTTL